MGGAVNSMENQLRNAFREVAAAFDSAEIGPLAIPPRRVRHPWGALAPVLAAGAVALLGFGTAVAVPRLLDRDQRAAGWSVPGYTAPAGPAPRFMLVVSDGGGGHPLTVQVAATGKVTARLNAPRPGTIWAAVAATADNRSFIVAAQADPAGSGCGVWLYRLALTASGQPARLSALP